MNGIEASREILNDHPGIKIITSGTGPTCALPDRL